MLSIGIISARFHEQRLSIHCKDMKLIFKASSMNCYSKILQIFDPTRQNAMLRTMQNQISRVGSLSWREHVLSA